MINRLDQPAVEETNDRLNVRTRDFFESAEDLASEEAGGPNDIRLYDPTAGGASSVAMEEPHQSRQVRGSRAVASWQLRRLRSVGMPTAAQVTFVVSAMGCGRVTADNRLSYRGTSAVARPTAAALLRRLWVAGAESVTAAAMCESVYGRPASLRAIRQTVFRGNRLLEQVECPLVILCHAGTIFTRPRVRQFERIAIR